MRRIHPNRTLPFCAVGIMVTPKVRSQHFLMGGKYVPSRLRLLPRSCLCNGLLEWRKSQGSKATIEQALVDVDVVAY
jgi:hypothetical protein